MDDTTSKLAMFLIIFWVLLLVIGGIFKESLLLNQVDVQNSDDNPFNDNVYQNDNARGSLILQVMTFQLTDQVPVLLSVFLNVILVFSIYVMYMVLHPLK